MFRRLSAVTVIGITALLCACLRDKEQPRPEIRSVYRAARTIEAALAVGINLPEFGTLTREMSKEVLLARDQLRFNAPGDASSLKILEKYGEMLVMYQDSAKVWQLQIQDKKYDPELPAIAARYGMASAIREWKDRSYGITTTEKRVDYDAIRQAIWSRASKLQEEQVANVFVGISPEMLKKGK